MEAAAYGAAYGVLAIVMAFYWVVMIAIVVVQYVAQWKIFVKTGEPGWKSLVPFLNGHTLYKKFWKPVYYWLTVIFAVIAAGLMCAWAFMAGMASAKNVPVAFTGLVWAIYAVYVIVAVIWNIKLYLGMARSFGYGGGFAAGLLFLPLIFQLILAFNKDAYKGNTYIKQAAPQQDAWTQPPESEM